MANMRQQYSDAQWTQVQDTSLPENLLSMLEMYRAAYKEAKAAKELFEQGMAEALEVPVGYRAVFGYNFGKLSVAIVEDNRKDKAPKKSALTLAQYKDQMAANGRSI